MFSLGGEWFGLWIAVTLHWDSGIELTPLTQLIRTSYPWASRSSMVALADSAPATGHTGSAVAAGALASDTAAPRRPAPSIRIPCDIAVLLTRGAPQYRASPSIILPRLASVTVLPNHR